MARTLDKPSLYDTDYVAWLEEQAARLRAGRISALDIQDLAEELEGLARRDRHQLANRLETLNLHLLKWDEVEATGRAVYADAVQGAAIETQLSESAFSAALPYSVEQIFESELPASELPDQRSTRKKHR